MSLASIVRWLIGDMNNIKEFDIKEHTVSLVISLCAAFVGGCLTYGMYGWDGLLVTISSTILWGAFGFFASEYWVIERRQKNEKVEFLKKIDEDIAKRMDKICIYTALHTKNGSFERITEPLANQHFGNVKWIISKFISEKISTDFGNPESTNEIVLKGMNIHKYSKFSTRLYDECEISIYVNTLFAPKEWFKKLLNPVDFEIVKGGGELSEVKYPFHIKTLLNLNCSVEVKRLVMIEEDQWVNCFSNTDENKTFLDEFMRITSPDEFKRINRPKDKKTKDKKTIDTRFVTIEMIKKEFPQFEEYRLKKSDIAIYDRKVTTEWIEKKTEATTNETANVGDLYLRINPSENLLDLFDFDENDAFYHTYENLLDNWNNKNEEK